MNLGDLTKFAVVNVVCSNASVIVTTVNHFFHFI